MQPVNQNQPQHQVIPSQQRMPVYGEPSLRPAVTARSGDKFILPEDVVSLSSRLSLTPDSPVSKKPSLPVTPAETKALRESFSLYV